MRACQLWISKQDIAHVYLDEQTDSGNESRELGTERKCVDVMKIIQWQDIYRGVHTLNIGHEVSQEKQPVRAEADLGTDPGGMGGRGVSVWEEWRRKLLKYVFQRGLRRFGVNQNSSLSVLVPFSISVSFLLATISILLLQ